MKISEIAVKRPITTIMFFASLVMLGMVSFFKLPMQIMPDFTAPMGGAYCRTMENMSPEELERRIIVPLEGEIAQLPDVKNIYTFSWRGGAFFRIEFNFGANVRYRIVDLQERLDRFRRTFPARSMYANAFPFETSHFNREFMDLVIKGPRSDPHLEMINADKICQKLQDIDGVAQADIWGGKEQSVDVTILQDRLQEFGTAIWQVRNRVQIYANEPVFLGDVNEHGRKLYVRLDGQFKDASEIEDVVVKTNGGIAVRHLGNVETASHSRRWLRRVDGKPALGLDLEKEAMVNPVELSRRTHEVIDYINTHMLPAGYELAVTWESSTEILKMLNTLSKRALMGIFFSMIVLYLFIRNLRMSLIVCLVVPICVIATFNGMYFFGMSINMLTLVGLAVGVGSLIDASIVVLENVFRHHERGKDGIRSAVVGCHEVGKAVFALTITNILVFLPILFVEGYIRLMFTEAALAIIFPLVISTLVALSLVPMLTSRLIMLIDKKRALQASTLAIAGPGNSYSRPPRFSSRISFMSHPRFLAARQMLSRWFSMKHVQKYYSILLKSCLRHRVRFLIAIVLFCFYTGYYTSSQINRDVLQEAQDNDWFYVYVYLPNGTKQEYTLEVVDQVEDLLLDKVPEIRNVHSWVSDDNATIRVRLKDIEERDRESEVIRESLRPSLENFSVAEVTFQRTRTRGENQTPVVDAGTSGVIEVRGPEYNQINEITMNFAEVLTQIPAIRDVYSDNEPGPLEVHFKLDRDAAALLQITPNIIGQSIQMAQRRSDYASIQMKKGDEEIDIVFNLVEKPEDLNKSQEELSGITFEELKDIPIYSPSMGTTVPLQDLGSFSIARGMSNMQRENRERIGYIRFETAPNSNYREIEQAIQELIGIYPLPAGYRMTMAGISESINELYESLKQILILAGILIFMCIASLFESFSQPLVIFFSIPLAIFGIVWIFILTETPFNEMAGMGLIFLVGMLPNSAILLVHFTGYLRKIKFFPRERAIMAAGRYRLRPILMTVVTTILGLLPMAIRIKGQSDDWVPFALCVIGGLASSTVLTLVIVPGFYFIVEDITSLCKRAYRYVLSWRWSLVFWSQKQRILLREQLTAYRAKPPRIEPLIIEIDHLTRIYPPARLERFSEAARSLFQGNLFPSLAPAPGIVASPFSAPGRSAVTHARSKALDMISLTIEQGLFGLLGPNGAGKTTLLRLIAGIDQPTRGFLSICGYDMKTEAKKAQKLIGYLPQHFGVYSHMSAFQYLEYFALLKGVREKKDRREAVLRALDWVNLTEQKDVPVQNFSGGMMRRIGLAQILVKPPKVLIVDEPTVGLDPMERVRFRNLLVRLSQERVVILSTHIVEDVAHSCRRLALIDEGRVFFTGSTDELVESVRGKVWDLTVEDESVWHQYRRQFTIGGQSHTADGIRLRILSESPPAPGAAPVDPSLEDAYLYHTRAPVEYGLSS
ncbi:MAG: efflux RND transporter permease subunit [Candidatus Hinthialibacter sp.]